MKELRTAQMLFIDDRCRHKESASNDQTRKSPILRLKIGMECRVVTILGFLLCHAVSLVMQVAPGIRCCAVVSSSTMRAKRPQPGL